VTPAAVLLVAFAQGSARLVPFAPASVGAAVAMLAATFASVTGHSGAGRASWRPSSWARARCSPSPAPSSPGHRACARRWDGVAAALRAGRRRPVATEA
jgi:hypothetical protein